MHDDHAHDAHGHDAHGHDSHGHDGEVGPLEFNWPGIAIMAVAIAAAVAVSFWAIGNKPM